MSSVASQTGSTVEREGVERLVPRSRTEGVRQVAGADPAPLQSPPHPLGAVETPRPAPTTIQPSRPALADTAAIGALVAIAAILGTRLWLGLSIAGAFVLALLTIPDATPGKIAMLGVYGVLTVLPCAYLDLRRGGG